MKRAGDSENQISRLTRRVEVLKAESRAERRCRKALLRERETLLSILESVPAGIGINEHTFGKILYENAEFTRITGYTIDDTPTVRQWLPRAYPEPTYRRQVTRIWKEMLEAHGGDLVLKVTCKDGSIKNIELRSVVRRDGRTVNMFSDVTRRERAEAELKDSETQFRLLFEKSADAVFLLDGDEFVDCNEAAVRMLRCRKKEEVLKASPIGLSPWKQPDGCLSSEKGKEMINLALKKGCHRFEWVHRRFDGELFPTDVVLTPIPLRGKQIMYTTWRDITEQKRFEEFLQKGQEELEKRVRERTAELLAANDQLRKEIDSRKKITDQLKESRRELQRLSEHLQAAREEERTRIAREVHDELGQMLSTLKIDLVYLGRKLHVRHEGEIKVITDRLDATLKSVRQICTELRPTILDHFGLAAAIDWQAREFQKRTGIRSSVQIDPDIPELSADLTSALFRIFQEALTNITRHAVASRVHVNLRKQDGYAMLCVEDNGKGISDDEISSPTSLGIIGIRERVRFWGGEFTLQGSLNRGTVMKVCIPLDGRSA